MTYSWICNTLLTWLRLHHSFFIWFLRIFKNWIFCFLAALSFLFLLCLSCLLLCLLLSLFISRCCWSSLHLQPQMVCFMVGRFCEACRSCCPCCCWRFWCILRAFDLTRAHHNKPQTLIVIYNIIIAVRSPCVLVLAYIDASILNLKIVKKCNFSLLSL